jgi:eukaryotic-like serine/threonine-protein kinase
MAPEQHRGDVLTSAADQFSFCVALWEALHGEPPFDGLTRNELVANVLAGKLRSPAKAGAVPGWLRHACTRGLAAEPTQRWPSMRALLDALAKGRARAAVRRGLVAVGVLVVLGVGVEAHRRWDLAQRTAACEASGAEVELAWNAERQQKLRDALVATGVSYAAVTADKVAPRLEQQAQAWREARVDACLDADVRGQWDAETLDRSLWCLEERRMELQSLVDELTLADPDVLNKAVTAAAGLASVAACRDAEGLKTQNPPPLADREALRAVRADVVRAGNLQQAGRYDKGLELVRDALGRAEALGWPPLVAAARLQLGTLLEKDGAYPQAETELEQAYFDAQKGVVPEVVVDAAMGLSYVVGVRAGRYVEGQRWARLAEVALEDVLDREQLRRANLLSNLAIIHNVSGAHAKAKPLLEEAIALQEHALGSEHPDMASSINNLASVNAFAGDYDEAKALHERALALWQKTLGPDHPNVAGGLTNLANDHWVTGEYDEARKLHEQAIALWEKTVGPDHPELAKSLLNLAAVHESTGDYRAVERLSERAIALLEKALGPDHPSVARGLDHLANAHGATGDYEGAKKLYQRALAIREKVLGPDHPTVASSLNSLANLHEIASDYDAAKVIHERALTIREKILGPEHPDVALSLVGLAWVALEQHRPSDAIPLAQRAVTLREQAGVQAELLAEARFALARALAEAPDDAGRDQVRASRLAEQARDDYRVAGNSGGLAEVEAWLAAHASATTDTLEIR